MQIQWASTASPAASLAALAGGFNHTMSCMTLVLLCRHLEARQPAAALPMDNAQPSDCLAESDASEADGCAAGQVDPDR